LKTPRELEAASVSAVFQVWKLKPVLNDKKLSHQLFAAVGAWQGELLWVELAGGHVVQPPVRNRPS